MQRIKLNKEPLIEAKLEAFTYQKNAVEKVKDFDYCAIFHEQGLGKTKIAVDVMLYWLKNKIVDTILIVTKKQLIPNWQRELSFHTFLTAKILTNNRNDNYYIFNGPSRVMITNFETIPIELDRFKLFLKSRSVAIIIDESAKLKNPESALTKTFFELSPLFQKKIIMTGTPVANRPYDIWAQIYFLDLGKSLGTDFYDFKRNTDLSNDLYKNEILKEEFEKNVSSIFNKISGFSVRETKKSGVINLPPKEYYNVTATFEKIQLELYKKVQKEELAIVMQNGTLEIDDSTAIIKRLLRLVQIASNPHLVDESYCQIPGKFSCLNDLVNKIISNNEKCIVWTAFIENVDWLHKQFSEYSPVKIHGKLDMIARDRAVREFINNPDIKILFATPSSSKEGLTLTVANNVIFYDRNFSLDDYLQAQDRIHRISQKKICKIYNIIMENSIDEWVDSLIISKNFAAKLSQGDISIDEYKSVIDYSFSDIVHKILGKDDNE
jgi:SNF2 family DNA or RNA helicase